MTMATMISEVYDALLAAGAPEDKARKAADAIAGYENRVSRIDNDLTALRGEMALVKWMLGFNLAMTVAILWKVFS
jgi:hypothetical protein